VGIKFDGLVRRFLPKPSIKFNFWVGLCLISK